MPTAKPTQTFIPIKDIRDNVVILKDGGMRAVVIASSLNFALKSADEQKGILFQFQDFLNSLDFSVQIVAESRRLDIAPYLSLMEEQYRKQESDLMKLQTREYIEFIRNFTDQVNIMSKSFYIVVPYSPTVLKQGSGLNPFAKKEANAKVAAFEENRSQLEQRVSVVEQGLGRCGVRVLQLGTEELVELYYKVFNPGETEKAIKPQQ
jgi:hypothetical protein